MLPNGEMKNGREGFASGYFLAHMLTKREKGRTPKSLVPRRWQPKAE